MFQPSLPLLNSHAEVDQAAQTILSHIKQTQFAAETDVGHFHQSAEGSTAIDGRDLQDDVIPSARWSEIYE